MKDDIEVEEFARSGRVGEVQFRLIRHREAYAVQARAKEGRWSIVMHETYRPWLPWLLDLAGKGATSGKTKATGSRSESTRRSASGTKAEAQVPGEADDG